MSPASRRTVVAAAATTLFLAACSSGDGTASSSGSAAKGAGPTVTDDVGRTVTFDAPVTKAVVANRYNSELIRAMGDYDKVISADQNTTQDRAYWPSLDPG